jgi:hypothetical protein
MPAVLRFVERVLGDNAGLAEELAGVAERVGNPASFATLSVGDMAPSNVILGGGTVTFVDLEYSGIRHAFYDAMFWHCIGTFPASIAGALDAEYRAGLSDGGLRVSDDVFRREMTRLMSHRLFWTLSWDSEGLLTEDREIVPGGPGMREVLLRYLADYVRGAAAEPEARALRDVASSLLERLTEWWPAAAASSADFACFRSNPAELAP